MPVPVRHFGPMPGGDAGTLGTTVPWIERLIDEGKEHPAIRKFAAELSRRPGHPIDNAFRFVQSLPYRFDPSEYEMLQGAPYLLRQALEGRGDSDCDCRVILLNSLLEAMGYETRIVLIRGPKRPGYSHIYSQVKVRGEWVPLDTIFPNFTPGMEVPDFNGSKTPILPRRQRGGAVAALIGLAGLVL